MTKWEYKFLSSADLERRGFLIKTLDPEEIEKYLNSIGDEGWEIINVDFIDTNAYIDFRGIAKRPIN